MTYRDFTFSREELKDVCVWCSQLDMHVKANVFYWRAEFEGTVIMASDKEGLKDCVDNYIDTEKRTRP